MYWICHLKCKIQISKKLTSLFSALPVIEIFNTVSYFSTIMLQDSFIVDLSLFMV